jgi:ankyrin repeat protein
MTALMLAAKQGDLNAATYLVEKKADVGAKEDGNWSVLHYAALSGNLALVTYLVSAGASARLRSYTSIFYVLPGIQGSRPTLPLNAGSYPADAARAMARFLRDSGDALEAGKRDEVAAYLDSLR